MKLGHVRLRAQEKAVTIWLPISKCDQQGLGIKRTLKRECSWLLAFVPLVSGTFADFGREAEGHVHRLLAVQRL